jgi:hypothetical protein
MIGVDFWKTWNKKVVWTNFQLFFSQFHRLYQVYIDTHFPKLRYELSILRENDFTIIYLFHFDETKVSRPYAEAYLLRSDNPGKAGRVFCFRAEDPENPIDRKKFFIDNEMNCQLNGEAYHIVQMHVQVLEFLFALSPTYNLLKEKLLNQLKKYFAKKVQ